MAARVTKAEVQAIMEPNEVTTAQYAACIIGANVMVNTALGEGTTDILKEIERWVAAHMVTVAVNRQASKEGAGGAEITYTGSYGEGLKSTTYGQMALTLDTTGKLASLIGRSAKITAVKSFD